MDTTTPTNRYADDWNGYSAEWHQVYGDRYTHLGDEWCDDGTPERQRERKMFAHLVEPWLGKEARVLEIGPGGGKWTVRLAPRVRELMVFDVASAMIERTRERVEKAGLQNVSFTLGNGRDLAPLETGQFDVVFSYDVFVHIAPEDTVAYVSEIARVLRPGGTVILHHAVNDVAPAWDRIEAHNDWYRGGHTRGQYYYFSREALDRLYARFGLRVESSYTDYCTTVVVARKPLESVASELEQALRRAATATDEASLRQAADAIAGIARDVVDRVAWLTPALTGSHAGHDRYAVIQEIRKVFRG